MQFASAFPTIHKVFPISIRRAAEEKMLRKMSADVRALSRHEVYDLLRGGLWLAATIALALIVPPKVWGVDEGNSAPNVQITSGR